MVIEFIITFGVRTLKYLDMKTFTTLKEVRNWLDDIDGINAGGCGLAALAMFRWLQKEQKLMGNESFTYLYQSKDYFYTSNSTYLKDKSIGHFNSCCHIMFCYEGINYDSNSNRISDSYPVKHEGITESLLVEALNFGGWNCEFNRRYYLPIIEERLDIDLSDVSRGNF